VSHPDLDALDMAILLRMNFYQFVITPADMAAAIATVNYDEPEATAAIIEAYPEHDPDDVRAAVRQAYS
jgi:hypothetical protein